MNILSQLNFVRPLWFFALIPFGLLMWYLINKRLTADAWRKACDVHLLPFVLLQGSLAENRGFLYCIGIAGVVTIIALAGPAWERLPQPVLRDETGLVIALDLSRSMSAVDVEPSRIVRARFKIDDFLTRRQGGQVALLVYSNRAFPVVPLTHDISSVKTFLQAVDTSLMPSQGSRPDIALQEASKLIKRTGLTHGRILLVTDFADESAIAEAQRLARENFQVTVLGVGTLQGSPIFLPSGDILKDQGKTVVSRLKEEELQRLAAAGRGIYRRLSGLQNDDIDTLLAWSELILPTHTDVSETNRLTDVWREQGPWLVLLLLPIALLSFRRGVLVIAMLILLFPFPSEAFEWRDLWLKPDQRGLQSLNEDDASAAVQEFEDPRWKSVAQYRNRDYAAAAQTLESLQEVDDFYNKGNALANAGDFQAALKAYNKALELNSKMEDAIHNQQIIKQILQEQNMQRQEQGEQSQTSEQPENGKSIPQDQSDDENSNDEKDNNKESSNATSDESDPESDMSPPSAEETMDEQTQALEQALQRVQDDPHALLKRKFRQLQRKSGKRKNNSDMPW